MTASTATAPADDVTPYARKALIASTAGYAMDGFDFLILGFMLTRDPRRSRPVAVRGGFACDLDAARRGRRRHRLRHPVATISGASGC